MNATRSLNMPRVAAPAAPVCLTGMTSPRRAGGIWSRPEAAKRARAVRASLYRMLPVWPHGEKQVMMFGYTDSPLGMLTAPTPRFRPKLTSMPPALRTTPVTLLADATWSSRICIASVGARCRHRSWRGDRSSVRSSHMRLPTRVTRICLRRFVVTRQHGWLRAASAWPSFAPTIRQ
jgi:hypothetical protein